MTFRFFAIAALLAGCSYISSDTVERIANISPLKADPGDYTVRATLPEGLDVQPGGAVLSVAAQRNDTHAASREIYVLQRLDAGAGTVQFRIAPDDLPRLKAQQALIADWSDALGGTGIAQFSVDVKGCRVGAGPNLDDTMSVSLISASDGSTRQIVPPTAVRNVLLTGGNDRLLLDPCT
ncbi:hypothetical protein [Pseudoprimorskyibacter insulae]|uniref:Lipoprotein n=1 Tax=Pseudoprimorskyibacter insulae TaxID=1695997 RepID=A0A2R8AUL8_9RHOB|nr:hypothetical protein [Pseudoprimorskyibacter insulae]SPF79594.1 hypothetical protein PRI8871_01391 [Pseudoprimorskyibacter insulae]